MSKRISFDAYSRRWPFKSQPPQEQTSRLKSPALVYKNAQSFFEAQCQYGYTDIVEGHAVVPLVVEVRTVPADGSQLSMVRVASPDGGFVTHSTTHSDKGNRLKPSDLVLWVPTTWSKKVATVYGDQRRGWVGAIRAKLSLEVVGGQFKVVCRYDPLKAD